jgi:citrate lyase subunit beta/citryl-CoA lyase
MEKGSSLAVPRSLLFVPADRPDRHARALAAGADAVIFDLEDSVAPDSKDAARELAAARTELTGPGLALIRINSPRTEAGGKDLAAAADFHADGLVVPKADPDSVRLAAAAGLPLIALVETAAGVFAAARTAADPAVALLMMGQVDLGADLGVAESRDGDELLVARGLLVLAAAAAGKPGPLDGPCLATKDERAVAKEIARAKRLGFVGKACIHPAQVEAVTAAFSATPEEVDWAKRVVAIADAAGGGVAVLDGSMIDAPVVRSAQRILANVGSGARR